MRKVISWALCLVLCLPALAGAEEAVPAVETPPPAAAGLVLTGKVEAKDTLTVYAPFGGTAQDFSLRVGDRFTAGSQLFVLDTVKIYAPAQGTVRGILAVPGDSAAYVQARYGALCYIEPEETLTVQSSLSTGHDGGKYHSIHPGQTVYITTANNAARTGTGRITTMSGDAYTVEIQSGNLDVSDTVNIYHNNNLYAESRIGRGIVARNSPIAVSGEGSVQRVLVEEGEWVERGQVLFEMASSLLDGMEPVGNVVRAPRNSVLATINVAPGQMVTKDQPLATLYSMERLQLVSSVSEVDLPGIAVGDKAEITFDAIDGKTYEGTVQGIGQIGAPSENYAQYSVYIDIKADEAVWIGMSGTARLVK